jgi:hypothetical protein
VAEYTFSRQPKRSEELPATINREIACLKRALRLGQPKHKYVLPVFPHLKEDNVRAGFVEQEDFDRLRAVATELWLRLCLECAVRLAKERTAQPARPAGKHDDWIDPVGRGRNEERRRKRSDDERDDPPSW